MPIRSRLRSGLKIPHDSLDGVRLVGSLRVPPVEEHDRRVPGASPSNSSGSIQRPAGSAMQAAADVPVDLTKDDFTEKTAISCGFPFRVR